MKLMKPLLLGAEPAAYNQFKPPMIRFGSQSETAGTNVVSRSTGKDPKTKNGMQARTNAATGTPLTRAAVNRLVATGSTLI